MTESENDIDKLAQQFQRTHGTPPTHLDAPSHVAREVEKLDEAGKMLPVSDMIEYLVPPVTGEVVTQSPESLVPTKEVPLHQYSAVSIKDELPVIGHLELSMRRGYEIQTSVLATVELDAYGRRCDITRNDAGALGMVIINGEGQVGKVLEVQDGRGSIRAGGGEVMIAHTPDQERKWTIEYRFDRENNSGVSVKVAEEVDVTEVKELQRLEQKERKKHKRRKFLTGLVGVAALYGTLMPGGFTDMAADSSFGTQETVSEAVELLHPDSNSPEAIAEWLELQKASVTVEQALSDLDEHDYQSILERAAEYKEAHAAEFIDSTVVSEALSAIASAETKEDAVNALAKIGGFYGYTFQASDGVSLEALKHSAPEVVAELTKLPTGLTSQALLKTISFDSIEEVNLSGSESRAGFYRPSEEAIHLASTDDFTAFRYRLVSTIPGSSETFSIGDVFSHEFAHALDHDESEIGVANELAVPGGDKKAENVFQDVLWGGILDYPQVMSTYSRADSGESIAENLSGIFTDRSDGLAHPDEVRSFLSPANKVSIANLVQIEAAHPGLADYLIAQNERLMRGQTLDQ